MIAMAHSHNADSVLVRYMPSMVWIGHANALDELLWIGPQRNIQK